MSHNYKKGKCIGKGTFGEVYKAVEIETNQVVALKLQDLEKAQEEIDIIRREIQVMSQISSPHVVRYFTSFIENSTLWIVMEHMAGGSLKSLLDSVGPFQEDAIAQVMKALCKGLEYIHKERNLHRDIKAENILLTGDGDVKLADFGVAGQLTNTLRQRNTFVGSPYWMAPEVITESVYNEKCDIWSVGITALELANGVPPYARDHPYKALALIPVNEPPRVEGSEFSKSFKDFVSLCLRRNPSERSDAASLVNHPFLRKARHSAIKELLNRNSNTEGGAGDGLAGEAEQAVEAANGSADNSGGTQWQFDFGTVRVRPDEENEVVEEEETVAVEQERETNMNKSEPVEAKHGAPESAVLNDLLLPVLSNIRAKAAEGGTADQSLMSALGALEVAFVDVEDAKSGACELFFRSLLAEASSSTSQTIRDMVSESNSGLNRRGSKR